MEECIVIGTGNEGALGKHAFVGFYQGEKDKMIMRRIIISTNEPKDWLF